MTAICGGGTSQAQPGVESILALATGRLGQLLVKAGLSEFSIALPFLFSVPVIVSDLCSTDPPAMTALTANEANAIINLTFGSDFTNGIGKLKDIVLNLIWLDLCECSSGTLTPPTPPATPSGTTIFVPPSTAPSAPTNGAFYPMLRSATKVLALGCGTPARPSGWFASGFDDSSWGVGVAPTLTAPAWSTITSGRQLSADVFNVTTGAGTAELVAPANPMPHSCEQFLVRWRFFLGAEDVAQAVVQLGSVAGSGAVGWTSGLAYVNGFQGTVFNAVNWGQIVQRLAPNQWNLIGFDVNPSNTSSANTWNTQGGIFAALNFLGVTNRSATVPCCPPDVTAQEYLDAILRMVTLIQRQAVPFAYVSGAAHTGLSGSGTINISGLLGVAATVTTLPASYGRRGTAPTEVFDLGFLTFGTPDGYPQSYRLDKADFVALPSRCGAYTTLSYDLAPGVVATLTELVREP
jgi:hypothetical protein